MSDNLTPEKFQKILRDDKDILTPKPSPKTLSGSMTHYQSGLPVIVSPLLPEPGDGIVVTPEEYALIKDLGAALDEG